MGREGEGDRGAGDLTPLPVGPRIASLGKGMGRQQGLPGASRCTKEKLQETRRLREGEPARGHEARRPGTKIPKKIPGDGTRPVSKQTLVNSHRVSTGTETGTTRRRRRRQRESARGGKYDQRAGGKGRMSRTGPRGSPPRYFVAGWCDAAWVGPRGSPPSAAKGRRQPWYVLYSIDHT